MNTSPNINMLLMSKKIGRAYSTFGQWEMHIKLQPENVTRWDHLGGLHLDGRIILKHYINLLHIPHICNPVFTNHKQNTLIK
jgi:hypothetical protein